LKYDSVALLRRGFSFLTHVSPASLTRHSSSCIARAPPPKMEHTPAGHLTGRLFPCLGFYHHFFALLSLRTSHETCVNDASQPTLSTAFPQHIISLPRIWVGSYLTSFPFRLYPVIQLHGSGVSSSDSFHRLHRPLMHLANYRIFFFFSLFPLSPFLACGGWKRTRKMLVKPEDL